MPHLNLWTFNSQEDIKKKKAENKDPPMDASGTEKETADRGSEVPGMTLENKQGFGEESTMSTQEKEHNGIAKPSSHQDLEVKPPLTTIKTGRIRFCVTFYNDLSLYVLMSRIICIAHLIKHRCR